MRTIRTLTALGCLLVASYGSAQTSDQLNPVQRPPVTPEVQAPRTDVDAMERVETRRRYWRSPTVRIAQNYRLRPGDTVREVQVIFGDAVIEGRVDSDVVVTMGSVRLTPTASVGGTVGVFGGSAIIEPGAEIGRDLMVAGGTLTAPETFSPNGYQIVVGSPWLAEILKDVAPWLTRGLLWGRLIVPDLGWVWAVVAIFFLIYLVLNIVFDRPVAASADVLAARPLSMFMTGLLMLLLLVPVLTIVAATVIGLLIIPFLVCAIAAAALIGKTAVARAIGRTFVRSEEPEGRMRATIAFSLGFALLMLAYMIPVLGFVTWALTSVLGFGAATVTFRAMLRRERPARPAAPPAPPVPPAPLAVPEERAIAAEPDIAPPAAPALAAPAPTPPSAAAPRYSEGLAQYPRATFLDRLAAFAIDAVLVAIINVLFDMQRQDGFYFFLLFAYHVAFWTWKGTTLGGIITNIRVTRTHGADLRFADALVRGLTAMFSIAALGLGCFWMLQDSESQMWHDKVAGTLVVKVPRELAYV